MKHWAQWYIGKQHAPDGDGPLRFSCWGLVRHVFKHVEGIDLPEVPLGEGAPAAFNAIRGAAEASGWRRVETARPIDFDVIVMRSTIHVHIGIVVCANGRVNVLHSSHECGVVCVPWRQAIDGMSAELWRRRVA